MLPPAVRYRAPRRQEIPWGREFFRSGAGFCRFSPFRIETWQVSSRFPSAVNRDADRPEQRIAATVQGAAAAEQRTPETHCLISSRVSPGAVDHAIAAILAAFKTGGGGPDETDDGGDRGDGNADSDARPFTPEELAKARRVPRVRTLRRALGLTQEEFAARYRIPLGTLRDREQGRSEPDQPRPRLSDRHRPRPGRRAQSAYKLGNFVGWAERIRSPSSRHRMTAWALRCSAHPTCYM